VARPEFWIIAGPNGAGKTTLVQARPIRDLLPQVRFLNPDDHARALLMQRGHRGFGDAPAPALQQAFLDAANAVEHALQTALRRGEAVGVETVLSSGKYRSLVELVREQGGFVGLIYVALASPELACARVTRRVQAGGHDVPAEKVRARWQRSLTNLPWFAAHASAFWVFDNSDESPEVPPRLMAAGQSGTLAFLESSAGDALRTSLSSLPRNPAR
jgi:predicted ABC-type ATPase